MLMTFPLEIITPQRLVFSKEVESVVVPTKRGLIGVLAKHTPLFTAVTQGEIKITFGNQENYLAIGGGFMEVKRDRVLILVSRAMHADELNEAEIKRAQDSAREIISQKAKGEALQQAQSLLRRSLLELKVLRRRKHPGLAS